MTTAQLNMQLAAQLDYVPVLNDIWGYVDTAGTEYALVGLTTGFSIVSLEDPSDPREVAFIEGQQTTWRDIKTWNHFAYVVSDNTTEGMLIVDLKTIHADTVTYLYWSEDVAGRGDLLRSHNIYMDEFGLAYLAGSNIGGLVVFDVKADPWNPALLKWVDTPYSHDIYTRDSIMYSSEIYLGELSIYDLSNPADVKYLGGTKTPFEFTHNAWVSDDTNTVFTTDERANAFVASYDISDLANIRELDRYRPAKTVGLGVIPHNVHVWDDYLIISYYTDGCIVVDASKPDNLIEVGNFDTFLGGNGGFSGAWGAYPFLPSGLVLVSDRNNGLFVLVPNYVRGCYLDVTVRDSETDEPIFNAEVEIMDDEVVTPDLTDVAGLVKTGKAIPGSFNVRASHPRYRTNTAEATFENGVQNEITIYLDPKPEYKLSGEVLNESDQSPIPNANVFITDGFFTYETVTDSIGAYTFDAVFEGSYAVYTGLFDRYTTSQINLGGALTRSFLVPKGYYDDFHYDYGWTVTGTSTGAQWVRDIPILETFFGFPCNPEEDIITDYGDEAFMTGNLGGQAQNNSVENGFTLLSSPVIDMKDWNEPTISFNAWLCVRFPEIQVYSVLVSNGMDTVVLDTIYTDGNIGFWRETSEYAIPDTLIDITSEMKIHFKAENDGSDNTVKAALDVFQAFDADPPSTAVLDPKVDASFTIYPNPGNRVLYIDLAEIRGSTGIDRIEISDMLGRRMISHRISTEEQLISLEHRLQAGIYIVSLVQDGDVVGVRKYVVE